MKSIETRLSRLEQVAPVPGTYRLFAFAETPEEAVQIRRDVQEQGQTVGLFIHSYLKPEPRHEG